MMLAAIQTMTNPDPIRTPRRHDPEAATQATTSEFLHAASPWKSNARNGYNEQHDYRNFPHPADHAANRAQAVTGAERRKA